MSDPCADPAYADSDYCRERRTGESVAAWRERRLRELDEPMRVTVQRGVMLPANVPWWGWAALGIAVLWFLRDE